METRREARGEEERGSKRRRRKRNRAREASTVVEEKAAGPKKARRAKRKAPGAQPEAAGNAAVSVELAPAKRSARSAKLAQKAAGLPTVSIALSGLDEEEKKALMESLRHAFHESGARVVEAKPSS